MARSGKPGSRSRDAWWARRATAPDAFILGDGSFVHRSTADDPVVWASDADFSDAWLAESRAGQRGPAREFLWSACLRPPPGLVSALVALARAAGEDEDLLGAVGAGPLEDVIDSAGRDAGLLEEIERAARQEPAFRIALRSVWIGDGVPPTVRERLVRFGARDLTSLAQ